MINFAFCYEREDERNFIRDEIQKCFKIRGVAIAIKTYKNAYELYRCLSCNCPDVLFYDIDGEDGLIHKAALAAKDMNENLVAVVTRNEEFNENYDLNQADKKGLLIESSYTLPALTRKHLWMYACLAYDSFLDDQESFTYYARPDYVHIPIADIMYFASEGRRIHVVSHKRRDTFYERLNEVENLLKQKNCHFVRIHQSYLVNTQFIAYYNSSDVTLINGEKLRISKYDYYRILNDHIRASNLPIKKLAGYC
jgi:DNA-binding LytR/AlgR family response regulator